MARVLILGSRKFPDLELVKEFVKTFPHDTILFSDKAEGVGNVARNQALFQDLIVIDRPFDWKRWGTEAGIQFNRTLVDCVDEVHCFWDGKSIHTKDVIDYASRQGKLVNCIIDRGEDVT
jgi:hypothetical protein